MARYEKRAVHMGVEWEVMAYHDNDREAEAAIDAALARIAELDAILSDYSTDSELSKLSMASPTAKPVAISSDLLAVLTSAQQLSEASDGAFDITIGPLTKLWRRARRNQQLPSKQLLEEAMTSVGYRRLKVDPTTKTANLTAPHMRLDLGGIAKGFAAHEALRALLTRGIRRAMVRGSGDFALGDPPPGEKGWRIGVAEIDPDAPPTIHLIASNCAISTSGDSRQHLVVDGRRYSHLIDPRTGLGIERRSSVTVIAPTGLQADSIASAISIMGAPGVSSLLEKFLSTHARLVVRDDDDQDDVKESVTVSPNFESFLEPQSPAETWPSR